MEGTLVMKFGGASVASPEHFAHIAEIILDRRKEFSKTIVVVSAMGKTTDQLVDLAMQVHPEPPRREYDMLVSVGERISISLLAMALHRKNCEAVSFTGSQSGIITSDDHSEALIVDVKPHRLVDGLEKGKVVIVAGFQGVSKKGEITTLGRGGSDTSAVALGVAFGARVEFYKDVPGIFSEDPKTNSRAMVYPSLSYEAALEIVNRGAKVLHPRSILLAKKNAVPLHVRSFYSYREESGTIVQEQSGLKRSERLYEGI